MEITIMVIVTFMKKTTDCDSEMLKVCKQRGKTLRSLLSLIQKQAFTRGTQSGAPRGGKAVALLVEELQGGGKHDGLLGNERHLHWDAAATPRRAIAQGRPGG